MAKLRLDRIRVLLVDDDEAFLEYLEAELAASLAVDVVGRARDGEEAVRLVAECEPDVVTMDIDMPHVDGVEATRIVLERHPGTAVVLVSGLDYHDRALAARDAGALDYVRKSRVAQELEEAIIVAAQEKRRLRLVHV